MFWQFSLSIFICFVKTSKLSVFHAFHFLFLSHFGLVKQLRLSPEGLAKPRHALLSRPYPMTLLFVPKENNILNFNIFLHADLRGLLNSLIA